jgi:hypothetical protein
MCLTDYTDDKEYREREKKEGTMIQYAHKSLDPFLLHKICIHKHVIDKLDRAHSVICLTCVF